MVCCSEVRLVVLGRVQVVTSAARISRQEPVAVLGSSGSLIHHFVALKSIAFVTIDLARVLFDSDRANFRKCLHLGPSSAGLRSTPCRMRSELRSGS
jgi:hypothetical protein